MICLNNYNHPHSIINILIYIFYSKNNNKKAFTFQPDKEYGYAYSWAQVICGFDFAPVLNYNRNIVLGESDIDDPQKIMRYPCFAEVVNLIDARLNSIYLLEDQIKSLLGIYYI